MLFHDIFGDEAGGGSNLLSWFDNLSEGGGLLVVQLLFLEIVQNCRQYSSLVTIKLIHRVLSLSSNHVTIH